MMGALPALAGLFLQVSLLAFGGGNTILPEMQRQAVEVYGWMNAGEFGALYALAQAAPGPNLMIVPLIGWHVAGLSGLLVSSVSMFAPSATLMGAVTHAWARFEGRPSRRLIQLALFPLTAGLTVSSAAVITRGIDGTWPLALVTAAGALLTLATRIHPVAVLAVGALLGYVGVG